MRFSTWVRCGLCGPPGGRTWLGPGSAGHIEELVMRDLRAVLAGPCSGGGTERQLLTVASSQCISVVYPCEGILVSEKVTMSNENVTYAYSIVQK